MTGLVVALIALGTTPLASDDSPLSLADLPAYRAALGSKSGEETTPATFRQLWDHAEEFRGRRVRVSGKVVRLFQQAATGELPALREVWIVSTEGDPLCLVHPDEQGRRPAQLGDSVEFIGVFLKRLEYRGADVARLAPLIVGGSPPVVSARQDSSSGMTAAGWALAVVVGGIALVIVVGRHLDRPPRRRPATGPDPQWIVPDLEGASADDQA